MDDEAAIIKDLRRKLQEAKEGQKAAVEIVGLLAKDPGAAEAVKNPKIRKLAASSNIPELKYLMGPSDSSSEGNNDGKDEDGNDDGRWKLYIHAGLDCKLLIQHIPV